MNVDICDKCRLVITPGQAEFNFYFGFSSDFDFENNFQCENEVDLCGPCKTEVMEYILGFKKPITERVKL